MMIKFLEQTEAERRAWASKFLANYSELTGVSIEDYIEDRDYLIRMLEADGYDTEYYKLYEPRNYIKIIFEEYFVRVNEKRSKTVLAAQQKIAWSEKFISDYLNDFGTAYNFETYILNVLKQKAPTHNFRISGSYSYMVEYALSGGIKTNEVNMLDLHEQFDKAVLEYASGYIKTPFSSLANEQKNRWIKEAIGHISDDSGSTFDETVIDIINGDAVRGACLVRYAEATDMNDYVYSEIEEYAKVIAER